MSYNGTKRLSLLLGIALLLAAGALLFFSDYPTSPVKEVALADRIEEQMGKMDRGQKKQPGRTISSG